MTKIAVTGGNGSFGRILVAGVLQRGYEAVIVDRVEGSGIYNGRAGVESRMVDLGDFESVHEALSGCDAVIHMAAIPNPKHHPAPIVFGNNVVSTYNVLEAAAQHKIRKVVLGSSESAYGFPWAHKPLSPHYVPVDEEHPLIPEDCYGTSKAVNELTGMAFHRRTGMQVVHLRLSSLVSEEYYRWFKSCLERPQELRRVLWSYVDARDAVEACLLAAELDGLGCVSLNIAADDTFQTRLSRELLHEFFPDVSDIRADYEGCEAFYSNEKAKRILGWRPDHHWRESGAYWEST